MVDTQVLGTCAQKAWRFKSSHPHKLTRLEPQMQLPKESIEELKQIHFKKTGEQLSDEEALEMGTRLINLLKIVSKKLPED